MVSRAQPGQEEVGQLTKQLYSAIHQADTLAANLGFDLSGIQEASVQQKLSALAYFKTSIVFIQLLLQDWQSTHDRFSITTLVIIQASTIEYPPTQSSA